MCVAYNLMRLVYLEAERGVQVSFAGGAQVLRETPWQHLEDLYEAYKGRATPKPGVLDGTVASTPPPGPPTGTPAT
jgi:hypothetical protein